MTTKQKRFARRFVQAAGHHEGAGILAGNPKQAEGELGYEPMIITGGWFYDDGNRRPPGSKLVLIQKQ